MKVRYFPQSGAFRTKENREKKIFISSESQDRVLGLGHRIVECCFKKLPSPRGYVEWQDQSAVWDHCEGSTGDNYNHQLPFEIPHLCPPQCLPTAHASYCSFPATRPNHLSPAVGRMAQCSVGIERVRVEWARLATLSTSSSPSITDTLR